MKASQIDVDTKDKVVTLTGTVDSEIMKNRALEIARKTNGVTSVNDNMMVRETAAAMPPAEPDPQRVALTDPALTAVGQDQAAREP